MSDNRNEEAGDLPYAVWSGTFRLAGIDVKCHVLNTGQRIIEADSVNDLFTAMGNGVDVVGLSDGAESDFDRFVRWIKGAGIPLQEGKS